MVFPSCHGLNYFQFIELAKRMFKILPQKIKLGNYFPPDSRRQPETLQLWLIYDDVNNLTYYQAVMFCYGTPQSSHIITKRYGETISCLSLFFLPLKKFRDTLFSGKEKLAPQMYRCPVYTIRKTCCWHNPTSYLNATQWPFELICF